MTEWLYAATKGVVTSVVTLLVTTGVVVPAPGMTDSVSPQTAIVEAPAVSAPYVAPPGTASSGTSTVATAPIVELQLPEVTPGLLPLADLSADTATPPPKTAPKKKDVAPAKTAPAPAPVAAPKTPAVTAVPIALTAQWILDATTLSFKERRDGPYEAVLGADLGNGKTLHWDFTDTTIGGTNGIPSFAAAFSCDPIPLFPGSEAIDQNPFFAVRTPYTCDISLTATSGSDLTTHTRKFSGTTDPGTLVITPPSSMDTVLKNDINSGGFTFDNQDSKPVTVTGVAFDSSYVGLVTNDVPLVLRFIADDKADPTLYDHHMEGVPEDPPGSYIHPETGVVMPVSFTIPAQSTRFLTVQALGVRKMLMSGLNPKISVSLRGVTTSGSDAKTTLMSPTIAWTCVVVIGGYDPNATTGAFAMGNACRN